MNFEKFVEEVKAEIKDYLPEELKNAEIDISKYEKLNESYVGMVIKTDEQNVFPTMNLNKFYEMYLDNEQDFDYVMQSMAEMLQEKPISVDLSIFTDYEKAKDHLFIRVSDAEKNNEYLEGLPHRQVENLAITYHVAAEISGDGIGSAPVTYKMMDMYGVTEEQLHEDALANSPKLFPAKVEALGEMMDKMMREDLKKSGLGDEEIDLMMNEMGMGQMATPLTVVTNEQQMNGAAVLFYPGQMEKLGESLKGDFFILPSSTHECLILPDDGEMTYQQLKEMVMEINSTQVRPEERLADEVYHYDSKDKVFEKAGVFADRQKEKEQKMDMAKAAEKTPAMPKPKQKKHDMSL